MSNFFRVRVSLIVIFETDAHDSHQKQGNVCAISGQEILITGQ